MNMNWQDYKLDETLVYYDRPLLCTVRDKDGGLGLTVFVEEDGKGEQWLLTPLSEAEKVAIKSGQMDLRDAFLNRLAYAVYQSFTGSAGMRQLETVPDEWLPLAGCFFTPSQTAAAPALDAHAASAAPSPGTPDTPSSNQAQ